MLRAMESASEVELAALVRAGNLQRAATRSLDLYGAELYGFLIHYMGGETDATEVFGVECSRLMITPLTLLQSEKPLSDWQHWSDLQRRGELESKWMLMAEGPESFGQRQERLFVERFPQFSATDDYGSCARGAASVFLS